MVQIRNLVDAKTNRMQAGFRISDRYVLTRAISTTTLGQTFLADDTVGAKQVLVVVHSAPWSNDPAAVERFEQRARRVESMEHANLCPVLHHGLIDDRCYIVLERPDGERLADRQARRSTIAVQEMLPIVSQLLKALEHAHARDVVARCLDPSRIFLCGDGVHTNIVRIVGLGVPEVLQNLDPPAEPGLIGDPIYAAPEQTRDEPVDARADVYALGRLMVTMLQGTDEPRMLPISQRGTWNYDLAGPLSGPFEPLRDLIEACTQPDATKRPDNGASMVEALIDAVPNASMFRLPRITGSHASLERRSGGTSETRLRAAGKSGSFSTESVRATISPPKPKPEQEQPSEFAASSSAQLAPAEVPHRSRWRTPMVLLIALGAAAVGGYVYLLPSTTTNAPASAAGGDADASVAGAPAPAQRAPEAEVTSAPVRIESNPTGTLYIDGNERGMTPFAGRLAPGFHTLEVVATDGEVRWKDTIDVRPKITQSFRLSAPSTPTPATAPAVPSTSRHKRKKNKAKKQESAQPEPAAAAPKPPKAPPPDDPFMAPSRSKSHSDTLLPSPAASDDAP